MEMPDEEWAKLPYEKRDKYQADKVAPTVLDSMRSLPRSHLSFGNCWKQVIDVIAVDDSRYAYFSGKSRHDLGPKGEGLYHRVYHHYTKFVNRPDSLADEDSPY